MMVLDGVTGAIANDEQQVELGVKVRLVQRKSGVVVAEQDIIAGDEMCIGYHGWLEGDYGDVPIALSKDESTG
jgi:hypothetical protein